MKKSKKGTTKFKFEKKTVLNFNQMKTVFGGNKNLIGAMTNLNDGNETSHGHDTVQQTTSLIN